MRAFAALALAFVACGAPPEPPRVPARPISLSLDDVTVAAAARELATAAGLAVVVDPRATIYAECAHVSITTPAPQPAAEVIALVGTSLASSGFTLTETAEGLVLGHDGFTRPAACAPPRRHRSDADDAMGGGEPADVDVDVDADGTISTGDVDPELALAVRQVSDTEWEITRAYRDDADRNALMRGMRVLPYVDDGAAAGLRLFGIRPGTLAAAIGFQNGDVVREVNGHDLTRPDTAIAMLADLEDDDEYTVLLVRRGEERTHVIRVVAALGRP